jgi:hypothetical protein
MFCSTPKNILEPLTKRPAADSTDLVSRGGNPDTFMAPLPMWYPSMGYTPMRYTCTALYFYTEHTQVPSQFFN